MKKAEPVRRCAGCGRKTGKSEFYRIIRLPSGEVVFDPELKRQGRSLYFCPEEKCFELLMRRKAIEKLMKCTLTTHMLEEIKCHLSRAEKT